MPASVLWCRRDLRLADNPALLAAREHGDEVLALFVLDDVLRGPAGAPRLAFLYRCLRALSDDMDGRLVLRAGRPEEVVPAVAAEVGAASVHVAADFGPYGAARDERVRAALTAAGVAWVATGSPYAVAPGLLTTASGGPFQVYTPFLRAWKAHGVRRPAAHPGPVAWVDGLRSDPVPPDPDLGVVELPTAGERAALARWETFRAEQLDGYAMHRDLPGRDATSRLSAYLKYGCVHPRTLLDGLGGSEAEERFRSELVWRDFYADVLGRRPESARETLVPQMRRLQWDSGAGADARFAAWAAGRTGYPVVDAGMRQLLAEAYLHNRVRMIVGSFLAKDLHLDWRRGARWFLDHLVDGDLASNQHGWQWVAGTGTDPAPFFRIFNPTLQGQRLDPDGDYVRRWVPELRGVAGGAVHEPWRLPAGPPAGYPVPIVDHQAERSVALERFAAARSTLGR